MNRSIHRQDRRSAIIETVFGPRSRSQVLSEMLVWYNVEAACPICGQRLRLRELGGGFALGQDSDLLVRMEGRHVVQAAIHTCLRCSFSGYPEDFGGNVARR